MVHWLLIRLHGWLGARVWAFRVFNSTRGGNQLPHTMFKSSILTSARSFSSSATRNAFAKMQLLGTVGSVNTRETKDGLQFINYSLAVNRYSPNEADNRTTDWFNISVFNERHIEFFNNYLKPGMQLYVECDVRQRVLEDENGENRHLVTNLRQLSYDVVRFAKREEESES